MIADGYVLRLMQVMMIFDYLFRSPDSPALDFFRRTVITIPIISVSDTHIQKEVWLTLPSIINVGITAMKALERPWAYIAANGLFPEIIRIHDKMNEDPMVIITNPPKFM